VFRFPVTGPDSVSHFPVNHVSFPGIAVCRIPAKGVSFPGIEIVLICRADSMPADDESIPIRLN